MNTTLEISHIPVTELIPYANNARTHSRKQVQEIARSISEFGFISPVLTDEDGVVIAGHGRVLAAQQIGLRLIPVIRADHLSPAQVRAYRLADNKIASNAGWDDNLLRIELEALTSVDIDFDVDLTGFSTTEIDLVLGNDEVPSSDDEIPPSPGTANTVSRQGDIWNLGPHRVAVGDCRDPDTIDRLMDGAQASMCWSDPPYNVRISGHVSGLGKTRHREFPLASGEMSSDEFTQFLTDALTQFSRVSVYGSLHYLFIDFRHMAEMLAAGNDVYDRFLNLIVWAKTNAGMGSLYRSAHELIFIFKKGSASHINNVQLGANGRHRSNVWTYAGTNAFGPDRDEALTMHPTVKPVQLLSDAILDVTRRGDIVIDGFLGSGSTLIAADRTGRVCYGVELDASYVDVTIDRWQRITGERATLASTDLNIDQVASERGVQREVAA